MIISLPWNLSLKILNSTKVLNFLYHPLNITPFILSNWLFVNIFHPTNSQHPEQIVVILYFYLFRIFFGEKPQVPSIMNFANGILYYVFCYCCYTYLLFLLLLPLLTLFSLALFLVLFFIFVFVIYKQFYVFRGIKNKVLKFTYSYILIEVERTLKRYMASSFMLYQKYLPKALRWTCLCF